MKRGGGTRMLGDTPGDLVPYHPPDMPLDELAGELPVKTVVALAVVGTTEEDFDAAPGASSADHEGIRGRPGHRCFLPASNHR